MPNHILHLDLDAFYPSVEVLDNPDLAGLPVIVGGIGKRGVVASASYEARALGVHSALPTAIARRRCPDGIYLRPRFERYRALSREIFALYRGWTELVEPLSLDEAYLDVSGRPESGRDIAVAIKRQVRDHTGLTVSAGVSYNKFLAKLASDFDKPDGLTCIDHEEAVEFLAPLPVDKVWGVGPSTAQRLHDAGYESVGDLAAVPPQELVDRLGKLGRRLADFARGRDRRRVSVPGRPKSISAETTFEEDIHSWGEAAPHVQRFAARIAKSLERRDLVARTVTLKVRFRDYHTITRSLTPGAPLREPRDLLQVARELARRVALRRGQAIRLIGLGVSKVEPAVPADDEDGEPERLQLGLFGQD